MMFGRHPGLIACVFLVLFSFVPSVIGAGSTWTSSLWVYGTRVSSVVVTIQKNFALNRILVGSEYLAASSPVNGSAQSSATTSFSGPSNESSLNLTFSWTIDPNLFRTGYWDGVCASTQPTPSGIVFFVVCSYSVLLGGSGTSWESNLTVYSQLLPVTRAQGVVNYTWTYGRTRIGTVGLNAVADPSYTNVVKDTTLSMTPNDTSVSLTLRLNYTTGTFPTTFSGGEGNGGSNPGTLLSKLFDRGTYQPAASSVFPPVLLSLSLTVIISIPVILKSRRCSRGRLAFLHMF